jgi:cation diffusion facilitator CzcD-associated flavoprotein CzcO
MQQDIVVLGAGPAGLGVAGALIQRGRKPEVLERAAEVGASWRNHYERLHLHTVKALSALPGMPFPEHYPRYVPRQGVVDYLAAYATQFGIAPHLGEPAKAIVPQGDGWRVASASGKSFTARAVVVATGANCVPNVAAFDGEASFGGRLVHSRDYRNAAPFAGERVLVVGMGNTGAEIALDLAENGVAATISVRSPLNIVRRDVLGRPTQLTALALARLPTKWGDAASRLLCDLTVGDLSRYGLRTSAMSPMQQLREEGKTPVIDIGTVAKIKSGEIKVRPGIERLTPGGVRFVDGTEGEFDAVILATGYRSGIEALFPETKVAVDGHGLPTDMIGQGALAGVYFVGFDIGQAGGLLRTIARQATAVAEAICVAQPA